MSEKERIAFFTTFFEHAFKQMLTETSERHALIDRCTSLATQAVNALDAFVSSERAPR